MHMLRFNIVRCVFLLFYVLKKHIILYVCNKTTQIPWYSWNIAESGVNHLNSIILNKIYDTLYLFTYIIGDVTCRKSYLLRLGLV
jgi:hypothetical protein